MNTTRQDAWTKDEDLLLAEIVLRYIREGKTQLEAFKEVAKQLSRTSAACGFRWNATIRKQYQHAIEFAKAARKESNQSDVMNPVELQNSEGNDPIDTAILLLKKIKFTASDQEAMVQKQENKTIKQLEEENKYLKEQLVRFDNAWDEMGKLWHWVKEKDNKIKNPK